MDKVSVLIVDDSALMRNLIGRIVESSEGLEIASKAMNGEFALQKIPKVNPDIILLDLEMPQMNGIEFLKERKRRGIDIPVVILSSLAKKGAQITMEALSLGASDFILKPSGSESEDIHTVRDNVVELLLAYGGQYKRKKGKALPEDLRQREPQSPGISVPRPEATQARPATSVPESPARKSSDPVEIVAIGISTGGPNALREVFAQIAPDLPVPVVVVQHMPAGFTEEFAKSLDRVSPLEVKEAAEGDILRPGRVLIAPGHSHMEIEKRSLASIVRLSQAPPVNGHRPSVDVLFGSLAKSYGSRTLAVIMTGMGRDGAKELGTLHSLGSVTLGQDEQSCVVFGMPRVALESGYVQRVVPLKQMAETISTLAKQNSGR